MYINDIDAQSANVSTWLTELGTSTNTIKGSLRFGINYNSNVFADYQILSSVDNGTWHTVTLRYVSSSNSSTTTTFTTNDAVTVSFARAGDAGSQYRGTSGSNIPIPTTGTPFTLTAANGCAIIGLTGTGLPTFTFPINSGTTQTRYFTGTIPAQTIRVIIDNSGKTDVTNASLYVNNVQLDCQVVGTLPPETSVYLTMPRAVANPSTGIAIQMTTGICNPFPSGLPISQAVMSYSGQYAAVAAGSLSLSSPSFGYLYVSNNYAAQPSWAVKTGPGVAQWSTLAISGNGQYLLAGTDELDGNLWMSSNYGVDWTEITNLPWLASTYHGPFAGSAISNTGQYQWVCTSNRDGVAQGTSQLFRSTDYGATWSLIDYSPYATFTSIAIDSTGQYVSTSQTFSELQYSGYVSYSSNGTDVTPTFNNGTLTGVSSYQVSSVAMNTSGQQQAVAFTYGSNYQQYGYAVSNNYGASYTINTHQPSGIYLPWLKVFVASGTVPDPVYGLENIYGVTVISRNDFAWWLDSPAQYSQTVLGISINGTPWYRKMTAVAFSAEHTYMLVASTNGLVRRVGQYQSSPWEEI
jgi:hypothetical protein